MEVGRTATGLSPSTLPSASRDSLLRSILARPSASGRPVRSTTILDRLVEQAQHLAAGPRPARVMQFLGASADRAWRAAAEVEEGSVSEWGLPRAQRGGEARDAELGRREEGPEGRLEVDLLIGVGIEEAPSLPEKTVELRSRVPQSEQERL
jgi:hypothetical protein